MNDQMVSASSHLTRYHTGSVSLHEFPFIEVPPSTVRVEVHKNTITPDPAELLSWSALVVRPSSIIVRRYVRCWDFLATGSTRGVFSGGVSLGSSVFHIAPQAQVRDPGSSRTPRLRHL